MCNISWHSRSVLWLKIATTVAAVKNAKRIVIKPIVHVKASKPDQERKITGVQWTWQWDPPAALSRYKKTLWPYTVVAKVRQENASDTLIKEIRTV